jgi:hypothetical protein
VTNLVEEMVDLVKPPTSGGLQDRRAIQGKAFDIV